MICREDRERLSAYLDGVLEAGEAREVERHAAACGECSRTLEEWRRIGRMLSSLPRERAPASVMEAVRRAPAAPARRIRFPRVPAALAAAAAAMLVGVGIVLLQGHGQRATVSEKHLTNQQAMNQQATQPLEPAEPSATDSTPQEPEPAQALAQSDEIRDTAPGLAAGAPPAEPAAGRPGGISDVLVACYSTVTHQHDSGGFARAQRSLERATDRSLRGALRQAARENEEGGIVLAFRTREEFDRFVTLCRDEYGIEVRALQPIEGLRRRELQEEARADRAEVNEAEESLFLVQWAEAVRPGQEEESGAAQSQVERLVFRVRIAGD
jgi:hypothetical protein